MTAPRFGEGLKIPDLPVRHAVWLSIHEIDALLRAIDAAINDRLEYERFIQAHDGLEDFTSDDHYIIESEVLRWRDVRKIVEDKYREVLWTDRDPVEQYGTPEHEYWLLECESREP